MDLGADMMRIIQYENEAREMGQEKARTHRRRYPARCLRPRFQVTTSLVTLPNEDGRAASSAETVATSAPLNRLPAWT